MKICIEKPTSFFTSDKNVDIKDEHHFFFYVHPNKIALLNFNLPPGCYYTDNKVIQGANFQPYKFIPDADIPEKEKKDVQLIIGHNPHKATIWVDHGIIIADEGLSMLQYKPAKAFVLGHELGHNYFGPDEDKCDDYSWNVMNRAGFNPSQVYIAAKMLFKKNPKRSERLIAKLKLLNSRH